MAFLSDLAGDDKRNMPHVDDSVLRQSIGFDTLPKMLQPLIDVLNPMAMGELMAKKGVSPGTNQLGLDLLTQFGPQFMNMGNVLNRQQAVGDINTDTAALNALQDSGGLETARELDIAADPLYNNTRSKMYDSLNGYLGMLSPTLTGSELAQIQRGIGMLGGIGVPSATRALQNAASFGEAGQNKMNLFGQGLNNAANIMQNAKLPIGSFTGSFGKQRGNFGMSQFGGVTPLSNTAADFGKQFLDETHEYTNAMNEYKAGRKSTGDKAAQDVNTAASVAGSVMGGMAM